MQTSKNYDLMWLAMGKLLKNASLFTFKWFSSLYVKKKWHFVINSMHYVLLDLGQYCKEVINIPSDKSI